MQISHAPETLFQRLGGRPAVEATVEKMYEKILSDPKLKPFFEGVEMPRLRRSQVAFVTMAFGGPNHYTGANMRDAHSHLVERGLSDEHFNAVATHLATAMAELGVAEPLIQEVLAVVETTRGDVLSR